MSFLIRNIQTLGKLYQNGLTKPVMSIRNVSRAPILFQTEANEAIEAIEANEASPEQKLDNEESSNLTKGGSYINKDRTVVIDVDTSIKYIQSEAYQITYGKSPVWKLYKRNFKGQYIPRKTRKTCIRGGQVTTGNPCPICRDEYLVLDYRNVKLLKQFISPFNGETLSFDITSICQKQHKTLLVALMKAKDCGLITFDPPHRIYDYSHWYKPESV